MAILTNEDVHEVRRIREERECGLGEAKRLLQKRRLIARCLTADSIDDLRFLILDLIQDYL